jgi:glycine/serine hydroxymethyltransferase
MKCPVCKKEFDEHTGRRPKKFCSDACKVKFWNKNKIAKLKLNNQSPKGIRIDIEALEGEQLTEKQITEIAENSKEQLKQRIADLQKELYECPKSYSETGKIIWVKERNKKIQELKNLL